MKKLYKVTFINQETGKEIYHYVQAESLQDIENEYCDIIKIEPLTPYEVIE